VLGIDMVGINKASLQRAFLALFFLFGIIVSSKIKLHKIFGLDINFSLLAIFGPVVNAFLSTPLTILAIFGARIVQIMVGISKARNIVSLLMYMPIFFASYYFGRLTRKSESSQRYLILIPLTCIVLFISHPIGREVWYFSLYWTVPIIIVLISRLIDHRVHDIPMIYLYALASTFVDHSVGSVMFLYAYNIPATFWNIAIPYVIVERLLFAEGITLVYLFLRKAIPPLREIYIFGFLVEREKKKSQEKSLVVY